MKKILPTSKGFTLIELLVVITIIAFLAIIGIVAFGNAQKQARDGRRRADIDAVATAMEANKTSTGYLASTDTTIYANGVIPTDPINGSYGGQTYQYTVSPGTAGAATYTACSRLENANGNFSDAGTTPSTGPAAVFYCRKNQQ